MHREVISDHWQGVIPVVFAPLAVVACGLAITGSRFGRWICSLFMVLGVGVGALGTWLHSEGEVEPFKRLLTASITARANGGEREQEVEREPEGEGGPPVLAPLSLSGLSAIGLLVVFPSRTRTS
jgi:hypothetical protein